MTENTSAIDHVLILSAQNYQGNSMAQVAKKGASQDALDKAAIIFCDKIVGEARTELRVVINGEPDKTSASSTLRFGMEKLKALSDAGLSRETKDYILRAYLSTGILDETFYVAEFGASSRAIGELKDQMIKTGYAWRIDEVAKLQSVPLRTREIDSLASECVKRHLRLNVQVVIKALDLGASQEAREEAARAFVKDRSATRGSKSRPFGDWQSLLKILGDCETCSRDILDNAVITIIDEIKTICENRELERRMFKSFTPDTRTDSGAKLVALGTSPHIADFFVQDLIARKMWNVENIYLVAHRCSRMLVESLARSILDRTVEKRNRIRRGSRYDDREEDIVATLKRLVQTARYASEELKKAVLEELLENDLADEAIEFAAYIT